MGIPNWIPDISGLDIANIHTYVKPKVDMKENWDEVPEEIKSTFDRLGIPEAEKTSLAGVGAQYDSEVVYHSIQEDLVKQGVIYTDIETALHEHEEIVKKYWMTLIPPTDHKWAALHGAVWWFLRIRSCRCTSRDSIAILLPFECTRCWSVRTYDDYRRRRG